MCVIVPLLPHSLQFGSLTRPHWWRFTGDGNVSYTDLSRNEILNWSFLYIIALPMLVLALVDPTSSRPPVFQVLLTLLSYDLPLCSALLPGPWCAFLLLMPLTTAGNETFLLPVAWCSCFQWCLVSVAYSLLGPLMFLQITSFLSLSGSQLLQFCCLLSPATSLPSGILLPWNIQQQRILVSIKGRITLIFSISSFSGASIN